MSTGTNRERIEQNNTKLNEIKGKINTLPNIENILDVTDADTITIEDNILVIGNKPYIEIAYIQSTGATGLSGQCINTQVKASSDVGFEIKISTQECSTDYPALLYGGSSYTNGCTDEFNYCNRQDNHRIEFNSYINVCNLNIIPHNQVTEVSFINGRVIQDGVEIPFESYSEIPEFTSAYDIYLLGANSNFGSEQNPLYFANAKVYYLKMYKGTQLVRDFIPVIRKSDNAVCLYDKVTMSFFTNAGAGSFTAGPVIN